MTVHTARPEQRTGRGTLIRSFLYKIISGVCILVAGSIIAAPSQQKNLWHIKGVEGEGLRNIEATLSQALREHPVHSTQDRRAFYQAIPHYVQNAMEPAGYFHSRTHIHMPRTTQKPVLIAIRPGIPMHITRVNIHIQGAGKNNPAIQQAADALRRLQNQTFSTRKYTQKKQTLLFSAHNQGYIHAQFITKALYLNPINNTAHIVLTLDTGIRYYFGTLSFQRAPYTDAFLQGMIALDTDTPYAEKTLLDLQQSLEKSRYFQSVTLHPDITHIRNHRIPVTIQTKAPRAKKYQFGAGYGTLTGPRILAGIEYRHLTRTGHALSAQTRLSNTLRGLAAKYYIPGNYPLTQQYILGIDVQQFRPQNGNSTSQTVSAGFSHTLPNWQRNITLQYLAEKFTVFQDPTRYSTLLYPEFLWSMNRTNDLLNPTQGLLFNMTLRAAEKNLLSETRFFQTELRGKYYWSRNEDNILIAKGSLGLTAVEDLEALPLSLRFFIGGASNMRGFAENSIGPGRTIRFISLEYQHRIIGNWYLAVFQDNGNASDSWDEPLKSSNGAGLVYRSRIGPIKVYLAQTGTMGTHAIHAQFSMGADW